MSNFDDEKDYDLDYFSSSKNEPKDRHEDENFADDENYGIDLFSSTFGENVDDSAFSVGEDIDPDDGEVDFSSFGKKQKEIKKDKFFAPGKFDAFYEQSFRKKCLFEPVYRRVCISSE